MDHAYCFWVTVGVGFLEGIPAAPELETYTAYTGYTEQHIILLFINFLGLTPRELLDHGSPILSREMPEFYYYENGFPYNSIFWNGKDKMEPCAGTQIARSTTFIIYIFHFKQLFANKNS